MSQETNDDRVVTTDPLIRTVTPVDGETIQVNDRPSTAPSEQVEAIEFLDQRGTVQEIRVGDSMIDNAGCIVGEITKIRADDGGFDNEVTHWVYIDYGKGNYADPNNPDRALTGEAGLPFGEFSMQMAEGGMTALR